MDRATPEQLQALHVPGAFSVAAIDLLVATQWSLSDYLAWLGRNDQQMVLDGWWVGGLVRDPAHWAEYGITTAAQLGEYLDAECAREDRKSAMAGDWGDD